MRALGVEQEKWRQFAGPGRWNDPDMLVIGKVGGPWGRKLYPTRLTPDEQYTHLTLWSLLAAPLLIGCPLDEADEFTLSLLTNDEVLAVNQDELGRQAAQTIVDGRKQVWVKELVDGSRAIGLFNFAGEPQEVALSWAALGLAAPARVRDLWRQQDLPRNPETFSAKVPRHGAVMLQVWPAAQ
jgi:alpha-galactosidase